MNVCVYFVYECLMNFFACQFMDEIFGYGKHLSVINA